MPETTQSDFVERLRDYAPSDGMFIRCPGRSTRQMNADIRKAADELERLQKIESQADGGRFDEWPTATFVGQLRMQARDSLDPEYSQFMAATANRMESLRAHCEAFESVLELIIANDTSASASHNARKALAAYRKEGGA